MFLSDHVLRWNASTFAPPGTMLHRQLPNPLTPATSPNAFVHAVIDNFSRRIVAWRVADTFAPGNSVAVLLEASQRATPSKTTPLVLADSGVENVNAHGDELINTGVLRRVLAFTELTRHCMWDGSGFASSAASSPENSRRGRFR